MCITLEKLELWIREEEGHNLEFKEASGDFDFDKLCKYCSALSNEGGGKLILGVTNKIPRQVVGTNAFKNIEEKKLKLRQCFDMRIEIVSIKHPDGRVLVIDIPPRFKGKPVPYKGAYYMRSGESLVTMTPDMLKKIFAEEQPDYSQEIVKESSLEDLDSTAIERFREMWIRKSNNKALENLSHYQLLKDAGLIIDSGVTTAALILMGKEEALIKNLLQAEVIFEYRSAETSIGYQQRIEYRKGFFLFHEELWEIINLRNDIFQYQDGLFKYDIPTFNETVIREGILNAISHRDYRSGESIFIRQFPNKIEIISPGGFPPGITADNILWNQSPRNRLIAEVLQKCGLVERSGQGADLMFNESIREGKLPPDFSGTDDYKVFLTINGEVQEPQFLSFLEEVGKQTSASFSTDDLLALDFIHRGIKVPEHLHRHRAALRELGIIERIGRDKYILSRRYYNFIGKSGVYTRKRGLDRETNKELLFKHIKDNKETGSKISELMDVLPELTRAQIKWFLRELKQEGRIHSVGRTKAGRWYPGTIEENKSK